MPDARCTRGLVRNGERMRARAYRLSGGTRHPLRDGFTAYAVLSPVIGLGCHRHLQIKSANLTPASRRQDHTVLPYAQTSFVLRASMARRRSRVHHIPSRVRDDARPPLLPEQDGRS